MLIDTMKEACVLMDKRRQPDGIGGYKTGWVESVPFTAAIIKNTTMEARIAEKQGVTELYTVTVDKGLALDYHDVFKRVSDGAIFRVTSNQHDNETPKVASFHFGQVTAERWELA